MSSSLTSLLPPRSCLFPTNIVTVSEPLKKKKQFVTSVLTNYHIVGGCIEVRVSNHDNQINQGWEQKYAANGKLILQYY